MGVGKYKIELITLFLHDPVAKSSNSGPGIYDDDIVTFCSNFNTGRIPAVFEILNTGNRDGTS